MVSLLDVNVLVALLVPEHEHHTVAQMWFAQEAATLGWATCAVTELGVIRVCAQLPGGAWPPDTTADRLLMLTAANREYVWWPDADPQQCYRRCVQQVVLSRLPIGTSLVSRVGMVGELLHSIERSPHPAGTTLYACCLGESKRRAAGPSSTRSAQIHRLLGARLFDKTPVSL